MTKGKWQPYLFRVSALQVGREGGREGVRDDNSMAAFFQASQQHKTVTVLKPTSLPPSLPPSLRPSGPPSKSWPVSYQQPKPRIGLFMLSGSNIKPYPKSTIYANGSCLILRETLL